MDRSAVNKVHYKQIDQVSGKNEYNKWKLASYLKKAVCKLSQLDYDFFPVYTQRRSKNQSQIDLKIKRNTDLNPGAFSRINGWLIIVPAHLWIFVKMAFEEHTSDETVQDARNEQRHQIKHHNVRKEVTLIHHLKEWTQLTITKKKQQTKTHQVFFSR